MAGTKIRSNHDQRKSPTKKLVYQNETIDQSNIVPSTESKNGLAYYNRISRTNEWYTPTQIAALSAKLLKWALEDPEADKESTFFKQQLVAKTTLRRLKEKFPEFNEDCELARGLIGCRLWRNALRADSGWRETSCLKFLPIYDEEYLQELQRQAAERINLQNAEPNKTITVLIPKFVDEKEVK